MFGGCAVPLQQDGTDGIGGVNEKTARESTRLGKESRNGLREDGEE
jgi:hypothetical protein